MARWAPLLAVASLLFGLALIGYAIQAGSASLTFLVIFPVVSGSSLPFVVGVLLTFLGIVGLMVSLSMGGSFVLDGDGEERAPALPGAPAASSAAGGVVLLGPIPIFFGAAKPAGRKYYLLALFAAIVLFAVVLALAWWL